MENTATATGKTWYAVTRWNGAIRVCGVFTDEKLVERHGERIEEWDNGRLIEAFDDTLLDNLDDAVEYAVVRSELYLDELTHKAKRVENHLRVLGDREKLMKELAKDAEIEREEAMEAGQHDPEIGAKL